MAQFTPSLAKFKTIAFPIPCVAPVTRAFLFFKSFKKTLPFTLYLLYKILLRYFHIILSSLFLLAIRFLLNFYIHHYKNRLEDRHANHYHTSLYLSRRHQYND